MTVKTAAVPWNLTDVVPVKLVPVIVTLVPTGPPKGVKLVMLGLTVKFPVLLAVPNGVVTLMSPVLAPAGTVAVILIDVFTVKGAGTSLKVTAVAPVKAEPLIVTFTPTTPLAGEKLVIEGGENAVRVTVLSVLVDTVLALPAAS